MISKRMLIVSGLVLLTLDLSSLQAQSIISNSKEFSIPSEVKNKIIGVRLSDIIAQYPNLIPGLANINTSIKKNPEAFFNQDKIDVIHDLFLTKLPELSGNNIQLKLMGFVKYKNQSLQFEKLSLTYSGEAKQLSDIAVLKEEINSLKDMLFQVRVGLIDRKVIIEDITKDITMVFPIGVGAFDEGVMNESEVSLVTPRFKNGVIDQRAVISKRDKPRYFANKPFIRVLKGNDLRTDLTAIGFHIEINDSFVRGFDSHGCMRLRESDLLAFHDLIMYGSGLQIPINISYKTKDNTDHPAPKRNKTFKTIYNAGSAASPFFIYDRDNLVQMVYKEGVEAPIEKLKDHDGDDYYSLFNYDTEDQMKEQDLRRKNECDAKVMSGLIPTNDNKKFQACLDAGKRKDSLKDKIYRKFMGIE